nr:MAG TPA: hypothetical protein [Caudoviricetes sp.]
MLYPDMKRCFGNNMIGCRINRSYTEIAKSARFSYVVPGYEEMLREQYDWMQNKQELYRTLYL